MRIETRQVATSLRIDEIEILQDFADDLAVKGELSRANLSAVLRMLIRDAMDARGIGVDPISGMPQNRKDLRALIRWLERRSS